MSRIRTTRLTAGALAIAALAAGTPAASAATHATDPRSPDARDAALIAAGERQARSPVVVSVSHPRGFAWGDAAIGAGSGAGALLLAAGAAAGLTGRRRERSHA